MNAMDIKTMVDLGRKVDVSRGTLFEAKRKGNCSEKTFAAIIKGLQLTEDQLRRLPIRQELEPTNKRDPPNGWIIESIESPVLVAANGVSYQVAKLRNEYIQNPIRYARGKFYDTLDAPPVSHVEFRERLTRHATICSLLPKGTKVPQHLDLRRLNEGTAWWVIDEWIPSSSLMALIDNDVNFPDAFVKSIGMQLLETLMVLHSHGCIVRELTPEKILIEDGSTNCFITDFEMAKMLDSDISVSGKWKWTTPYRAPEVNERNEQWQSDIYSWAMIFIELLSGKPKRDEKWILANSPSKEITKLLTCCLDLQYEYRHYTLEKAMMTVSTWEIKS
tara:strand:- start:12260 stop:13258 length:999 start_codon:yes stop_codon:yes gene_type:complete